MSNATDHATMTLAAKFFGSRQFSGRMVRRAAIREAVAAGLRIDQVADITGLDEGYIRSLVPTAARA